MGSRQKAIEELQKQIKLAKARLGPEGIARLQSLVHGAPAPRPGTVPYDRTAAGRALELFLKNHKDGQSFQKRLLAFLQKYSH